MDIVTSDAGSTLERLERFQALSAGQYWRAMRALAAEAIEPGVVLLIESIRWVDDKPHTIHLRAHPSVYGQTVCVPATKSDGSLGERQKRMIRHELLLREFLDSFEFEPNHAQIRADELAAVQAQVGALQSDLLQAQADPAVLACVVRSALEAEAPERAPAQATNPVPEIPSVDRAPGSITTPLSAAQAGELATGSLANALSSGVSESSVAAMKAAASKEHRVASIKADWITGKTQAIANTLRAMTPYYEEQAAAALAQTEDVRTYVGSLMKGLESLDLYLGKGVEVQPVKTGASAPPEIPLTFVQRKLMMDEELALWADVAEHFDFSSETRFFDALREHEGLVEQVFPTPRCVLVMAVTRRYVDYSDSLEGLNRNQENHLVFLLVRDGDNIHRVFSPVESHLGAHRLFPSKTDQDEIFRGINGEDIKFEDVAFTEKLARHENFALHYKRFLLLACGLDHRLKLFGTFYEGAESMGFVSPAFQQRYCRFLFDDEGSTLLAGPPLQPLAEFVADKNAHLRAGSRVLLNLRAVMNPTTAPSACRENVRSGRIEWRANPVSRYLVAVVYREADSMCVDVPVVRHTSAVQGKSSTFDCKVTLSAFRNNEWDHTEVAVLCLDSVSEPEIQGYLRSRDARADHIAYLRFFKHAQAFLALEAQQESGTRAKLAQALEEGAIGEPGERAALIDRAVQAWRANQRGRALPRVEDGIDPADWTSLLDQLFILARTDPALISEFHQFAVSQGLDPLRLTVSGAARFVLYCAPALADRDERLEAHAWALQISLVRGKTRLIEKARKWEVLPAAAASETTLHEWPEACRWAGRASAFRSFEHKKAVFESVAAFEARLARWAPTPDAARFAELFEAWQSARRELNRKSKLVEEPEIVIPLGVERSGRKAELSLLCVGTSHVSALLYRIAPDAQAQERLKAAYIKPYQDKVRAATRFADALTLDRPWQLMSSSLALLKKADSLFSHNSAGVSYYGLAAQDPDTYLMSDALNQRVTRTQDGDLLWMPESLYGQASAGTLIDRLLHLEVPKDFEPLCAVWVQVDESSAPEDAYREWIDLVPAVQAQVTQRSGLNANPVEVTSLLGSWAERRPSYRSTHGWVSSRAKGYAFAQVLRSRGISVERAAGSWVLAQALPQAPKPPEGVERIYFVREAG